MSDAPLYVGSHDPADVADYLIKFDDLLETAEVVTLQSVSIDAASTAVGLAIGSGAYAPIAAVKNVKFWLTCNQPSNTAFVAGVLAVVTATVTTSATPARTFQRSVLVRVQQSDTLPAPVTITEAKAHLRIVDDAEDDFVIALIRAAQDKVEGDTGLVLRARDVAIAFDNWNGHSLPLWRGPTNSVTSIVYDDPNGAQQTLAANQYRLRDYWGAKVIVPANGVSWPELENVSGCVRVIYNAGYANNYAVPSSLRQAALLLIGHWYENREAVNSDRSPVTVPMAYDSLITHYRVKRVS
jgi:uncharacterized phiE125 gp8 family phage protein